MFLDLRDKMPFSEVVDYRIVGLEMWTGVEDLIWNLESREKKPFEVPLLVEFQKMEVQG